MKIRLYVVTYKRNEVLNANLTSLWQSLRENTSDEITVTVLANHPDVVIDSKNQHPNLKVVVNTTRMPFAWGNLSRDWNYGLLDGFKHWTNPDKVDWVVLAQNDVVWSNNWVNKLAELRRFSFITQPKGDQVLAFQIDAVKEVGFFDERFTTLHFHELDYFTRAALILNDKASINDDHAGEASNWNPVGSFMITPTSTGGVEEENLHTMRFHDDLARYMIHKWDLNSYSESINLQYKVSRKKVYQKNFPREINWYPFFWDGIPKLPETLQWYFTNLYLERPPKPTFWQKVEWKIKHMFSR